MLFISVNSGAEKTEFYKQLKEAIEKINNAIVLTKLAIGRDLKAKDLPDRYLSLAALFIEKAKYLYYMEQEEKVINSEDEVDMSLVHDNRRQAIAIYKLVLDTFKNYKKRDRVLIMLANEYSEVEDNSAMIDTFKRLLREFPNTEYKKEGNLVLADHYYDEHRITKAMDYYRIVMRGKVGPLTYLAYYKMAWCHINLEEWRKALNYFEKVLLSDIEIETDSPFLKRDVNVRDEALVDSVLPYTNMKKTKAEDAPDYYFKLAPNRAMYIKVLDKLANRYFTGGEYSNAIVIYRRLVAVSNSVEKVLLYTSRIWKLLKHLKGTKGAGEEAELISKHLLRYKNSWRLPEEDREKFIVDFEMYMRHIATLADKRYQRIKKSGGKRARKASGEIAKAYKSYLQSFPNNKRYPLIRRNYSGILADRKDALDAGKVFEEMSDTEPSMGARKKALRNALYYYNIILKKEKSTLYEKVWARAGIKDLSKKYLKYYPNTRKAHEITFNIARLTFEQGEQEKGVDMLMDFMRKYPRSSFVAQAGHQVLDYYNLRTDYKGLVRKSKEILAIPGIKDKKFRKQINDIGRDAIKAEVAEQTEALATAETEEDFFVVAEKFEGTAIGEESLFNAFNVARLKKNHYLIIAAGQKMLKEYPRSSKNKEVRIGLANAYLENLQFSRAAELIEEVYRRYPRHKEVTALLQDAANIYTMLAEYERANRLYKVLIKRMVKNSLELQKKIGDNQYSARRYDRALSSYKTYNSRVNSVLSNALVARTYRAMGQTKQMMAYYGRAASKCRGACLSNPQAREAGAEAKFYLLEPRIKKFLRRRIDNRKLDKSVNSMTGEFSGLEKMYTNIVNMQDPTWAVASIYNLGMIYDKMADFLRGARPPRAYKGAQRKEFKKLMGTKVKALEAEAKKIYVTCANKSYDFNLFSEYAMACSKRSKGRSYRVEERYPAMRSRRSFRGKDVHMRLLKKPGDINLMQDLAEAYFDGDDFHMSKLICLKILEKKQDNDVRAILGHCYLEMEEDQFAYVEFKKVLASEPGHSRAKSGLRRLYKKYGNPKAKSL